MRLINSNLENEINIKDKKNNEHVIKRHSPSSLLLMEMIISILIFIVCGAICVQLFTKAHTLNVDTTELNHAVVLSESAAELYRNYNSDMEKVKEYYPLGTEKNDGYGVFFDKNFEQCEEENAEYLMQFRNYKYIVNECEMNVLKIVFLNGHSKIIFDLEIEK